MADALVKRATVRLLRAHPVTPGKFIILLDGTVADVEEALVAGRELAGDQLQDELWLPYVHDGVLEAIAAEHPVPTIDSLALVQTQTLSAALRALDGALKIARVETVLMRLGAGLSGGAFFGLTGELYDLEAAIDRCRELCEPVSTELIAAPHPDFLADVLGV